MNEVTVAPVTTTIRHIPSELLLDKYDGMPEPCAVNLDHLQTVVKKDLGALITRLGRVRMTEAKSVLLFALGFDE